MPIERRDINPSNETLLANMAKLRGLMGFWERKELDRKVRAQLFRSTLLATVRQLEMEYGAQLIDFADRVSLQKAEAAWDAMVNADNPLIARIYEHSLMQWIQTVERILGTDQ